MAFPITPANKAAARETDSLLPLSQGTEPANKTSSAVTGGLSWAPTRPLLIASLLTTASLLTLYVLFPTLQVPSYTSSQFLGFGINTGGSPDLSQCPSGTLGILGLGEEGETGFTASFFLSTQF